MDECGNKIAPGDPIRHELSYEGNYDFLTKTFKGNWEIWFNENAVGEDNYVEVGRGTWEISRDAEKYGV